MQDAIERNKNRMRASVYAALSALGVHAPETPNVVQEKTEKPMKDDLLRDMDKVSKAEAKRIRKQLRQQFLNQKQNEAVSAVCE